MTHTVPSHLSKSSASWLRGLAEAIEFSATEWHLLTMAAEGRDRSAPARA